MARSIRFSGTSLTLIEDERAGSSAFLVANPMGDMKVLTEVFNLANGAMAHEPATHNHASPNVTVTAFGPIEHFDLDDFEAKIAKAREKVPALHDWESWALHLASNSEFAPDAVIADGLDCAAKMIGALRTVYLIMQANQYGRDVAEMNQNLDALDAVMGASGWHGSRYARDAG